MFDVKLARMDIVVIVVSPLVSLMTDQTRSLRSRGVKAAIMSSMGGVEKDLLATADDLQKSSFLFCFVACGRWREALEKPELSDRVVAVAIDEAHCVSKWYVKSINIIEVSIFRVFIGCQCTVLGMLLLYTCRDLNILTNTLHLHEIFFLAL